MTLPGRIEDLDGAWLTAALRETGRLGDTESVSVRSMAPLSTGTGFSTVMQRLEIDGPAGAPASAVVKLPVNGEIRQVLDGIGAYRREVTFYRDLAHEVPIRVPECYVAQDAADSTDFVLLIEDLSGLEPADQLAGLTLVQAQAAVDALARFHAWAWESPRLNDYANRFPPLDGEMAAAVYGQFAQFFAMAWPAGRDQPQVPEEVALMGDRWAELLPFFVERLAAPRTLVHGELRAENLFLLPDGGLLMIDFQTVAQHAGIVDVAYLVTQSLAIAVRTGHDEALVRRYVDGLAAAGVSGYTFAQAWEQYRIALAFNLLLTGLAFGQYEQTDDRGRRLLVEMLARACDGIVANGTLELLP